VIFSEAEDILPIVDENDDVIGTARRRIVHARALRHRSAHVVVFNTAGRLLIQLRSAAKDLYPLYWDVSAGGHVGPDESYEQAARRELREELGLTGELKFVRKTPASKVTDWEFTCLYELTTDEPPRPNSHEIEGYEFVLPSPLIEQAVSGRRHMTPALVGTILFYTSPERLLDGN